MRNEAGQGPPCQKTSAESLMPLAFTIAGASIRVGAWMVTVLHAHFQGGHAGVLVKRSSLLNFGEPQLLETALFKKCTLIWH